MSNNENNQKATKDAFELLHFIVSKRLKSALLTVVNATNLFPEDRLTLLKIAKEFHVLSVAIVFNIDSKICEERDKKRADRNVGEYIIHAQYKTLKNSLKKLKYEGFKQLYILKSPEDVNSVEKIVRDKLFNDKKHIKDPFDIISDVHGCYDELVDILKKLGYTIKNSSENSIGDLTGSKNSLENSLNYLTNNKNISENSIGDLTGSKNSSENSISVYHPDGRVAVFLGDLVDRGHDSPSVLKLVMSIVKNGVAYSVIGNHDVKLLDKLKGKNVNVSHGL